MLIYSDGTLITDGSIPMCWALNTLSTLFPDELLYKLKIDNMMFSPDGVQDTITVEAYGDGKIYCTRPYNSLPWSDYNWWTKPMSMTMMHTVLINIYSDI